MKQIINGLRYDTNRAERIGKQANNYQQCGEDKSHPMYWTASLYITSNDRFFLAGSGNSECEIIPYLDADYAIDLDSFANKIIPVTEKQAFEWCSKHQRLEVTEDYFDHMIEDA